VSEVQNDRYRGVGRVKRSGGPILILLLREARRLVVEVGGCAVVIARKLCLFVDANLIVIEILRDGKLVAGNRVTVYSVNCCPLVFKGKRVTNRVLHLDGGTNITSRMFFPQRK
jgi:hypothetical protein